MNSILAKSPRPFSYQIWLENIPLIMNRFYIWLNHINRLLIEHIPLTIITTDWEDFLTKKHMVIYRSRKPCLIVIWLNNNSPFHWAFQSPVVRCCVKNSRPRLPLHHGGTPCIIPVMGYHVRNDVININGLLLSVPRQDEALGDELKPSMFQAMFKFWVQMMCPHPMTDPHQYTLVMLAYIPAPWILWDMSKSMEKFHAKFSPLTQWRATASQVRFSGNQIIM